MRFTTVMAAPKDTLFAGDAFRDQIGMKVVVRMGRVAEDSTLVHAEVILDGVAVELTFECPGIELVLPFGWRSDGMKPHEG